MSYKNNCSAAVVKSISIDRFSAQAKIKEKIRSTFRRSCCIGLACF